MTLCKRHGLLFAVLFGLLCWSGAALAESPIMWQFEFKGGGFAPGIDEEEGLTGTPFADVYGNGNGLLMMVEMDLQFYRGVVGSLAIGGGLGFMSMDGKSIDPDSGEQPGDQTTFELLPTQVSLVYHFDVMAQRWNIPFVPFAKVGGDYWAWWILDSGSDLARVDGDKAMGGTYGMHFSGGLKFLLDSIDPSSAQTFDHEMGVNNSYLMFEYQSATVNDFGGDKSFNLGGDAFLFGLAFEM